MSAPQPIRRGSYPVDAVIPSSIEQVGEEVVLGDDFTLTRKFRGFHDTLKNSLKSKGTLFDGLLVKQSSLVREEAGHGLLTIQCQFGDDYNEAVTLPPDEVDLDPVELNPRIERHPIFSALTATEIDTVRMTFESLSMDGRTSAENAVGSIDAGNVDAAFLLLEKLREGKEFYKMFGYRYTWSTHYWAAPYVSSAAIIEVPGGPLADVLDALGFDWLREADRLSLVQNGRIYKLTSSWLGAPQGQFDTDLYSS